MQSIDIKILNRIYGYGRGHVFTPGDFLDLASRQSVGVALHRLVKKGAIRNLARGLYDYPRIDPYLGTLAPTTDAIIKALKGRDNIQLQPSGSYAANLLGLSEQVPMKIVLLTDGSSRKVQIGKQTILLKRTTPKTMATAGKISGLLIQALRQFGQKNVDNTVVARLRKSLSEEDKKQILKDIRYAPAWIATIMRQVTQEGVI